MYPYVGWYLFRYTYSEYFFIVIPTLTAQVVPYHKKKFYPNFNPPLEKENGGSKPPTIENYGKIGIFELLVGEGLEQKKSFLKRLFIF